MPDASASSPVQPAGSTPAPATPAPAAAAPAPAATPAPAAPAANVAPQTAAPAAPRGLGDPAPAKAEAPAAPAAEPAKAPEAKPADWKLEAPKDSLLQAERVAQVEQYAKAEGYTREQAQKLIERENAEVLATQNAWLKAAQAHPELKDWDAAIDNANRALNQLATAEERKQIASSPFKHNPLFLAILNRAGLRMTREAAPVETVAPPSSNAQNPADRMYPQYAKR